MNLSKTKLPRKKMKRYDVPGHARELTFSCYHRYHYFKDVKACSTFLNELEVACKEYGFKLWAYVVMPNHVHLLLWPQKPNLKMSTILQFIKGKTSTFYKKLLLQSDLELYKTFIIKEQGKEVFKFWQAGGGLSLRSEA